MTQPKPLKQTTQPKVDEILDLLEFHRKQSEAWADSPSTRETGTYYLGKVKAFKEAIDLVKQLKEKA